MTVQETFVYMVNRIKKPENESEEHAYLGIFSTLEKAKTVCLTASDYVIRFVIDDGFSPSDRKFVFWFPVTEPMPTSWGP